GIRDRNVTGVQTCALPILVGRFMVVNETDKNLIVLRPYQMYATEALIKRALDTKNNGYIWHTTGSGKTLTSFKASQLLAQERERSEERRVGKQGRAR